MATKKQAPKTARPSGSKAAKSAKPVKKAAPKGGKPAAKKVAAKPAPKKAAPKKAVKKAAPPPKKTTKPAPKPVKKQVPVKKTSTPVKKSAPAKALPAKKQEAPKKQEPPKKQELPKKAEPKKEEPVKKPVVAAPTHQEVKPAIKPLEKPVVKKDPPKPTKVVIPKTSTTKSVKYNPDFTKSVLDTHNQINTGPTMRYSDADLTEFRELIMKKLETAKKELAYLQGLITRKDEGDMEDGRYMTMEDGSMSMEREQLSQMASRQIQFIDHLEKAIMRIENKTYGICRVTGKLIDKARLRAVPHATLSIEAKQMMNK
jgi:RNA polymerase-binding transcription factor DksA